MSEEQKIEFVFYRYDPSLAGGVIFSILFFLSSFYHAWQLARSRTWYFIPFFIGHIMQAIGYIGRIISHFSPQSLPPYIMQTLLLLVAPALYAASIYMILGRLTRVIGAEHLSPIRINWLTKIFVGGDILSFMMQSGGGGIMSGGTIEKMELGEKIVLGGLFVQIIFFSIFFYISLVINNRINKCPTERSQTRPRNGLNGWVTLLRVLYAASALILVRSVFRVIEYIQGNDGYLMSNEVWLYLFDSVLMLAVGVLFNVVHPSNAVPTEAVQERIASWGSKGTVEMDSMLESRYVEPRTRRR